MKIKIFSVLFILLAGIAVAIFAFSYQKNISMISKAEETPISSEQPITILVLGKTGKVIGWNRATELADTILVADYQPKLGVLNLVSLPRDLWFNFNGAHMKLNEVAVTDNMSTLLAALPGITGLSTDKYIVVDIDVLKDVVDDLGGIDVTLKDKAVDWVSGFTMEAGPQHLDGDQVIWLVRNRFAPEGDFFRQNNQHDVIEAIIAKYNKMNMIDKTSFAFKLAPEIQKLDTNINPQTLMPLITKFGNVRFNDVIMDFDTGLFVSSSTPIDSSNASVSTSTMAYILVPKAGLDNYSDIKSYIESKLEK